MTTFAVTRAMTPVYRFGSVLRSLNSSDSANIETSHCATCLMRELAIPCGLTGYDTDHMDDLVHGRKRVKRGQTLYRAGDPFRSIYAVRCGVFKSCLINDSGREQVTDFHIPGEVMGMDGIDAGTYASSAIALDECDVCELPYWHLEKLAREDPCVQPHFHRIMGREMVRKQAVMQMLRGMRTEQRLAAFLLDMSRRFQERGYSPAEFNLRMTRHEIGSYLGMTFETTSRLFSRFQNGRLIEVLKKYIRINDRTGLKSLIG